MKKQLRKKLQKLQHRLKVTFEDEADTDAVLAAMIGQGYRVSERLSGLSTGAVSYRMKLARGIYGLPKGVGFAQEYRQGGGMAEEIRKQIFPAIRATIMSKLVKERRHPRIRVVESKK